MLRSLKEYLPNEFVKLTFDDDINNDYHFKEGLNIDIHPFNNDECEKGGFYFCRYKDLNFWFRRYFNAHLWRVKIPEGEKVIDFGIKLKAHKIILYDCCNFYEIDELCKMAVAAYPYFLEYVYTKTPLLCQIALENRNRPDVYEYIKKMGILYLE